jgi:thiamine phosphate synthase YjbQ (UPF0047 family)
VQQVASPLFREILRGPENTNGFKLNYLQDLAKTGRILKVTVKKPPILPKGSKEVLLAHFGPGYKDHIEDTFRYWEDQLIVHDISRGIDGKLKGKGIKQGLAIVSAPGLALMEHEPGAVTDLKIKLKEIYSMQELKVVDFKRYVPNMQSLLNPYLPIPIENVLVYGTWSRPAIVNEDIYNPVSRFNVSLVKGTVDKFTIEDKEKTGFWHTDITDEVQKKLTASGEKNGHVVITTPHTTVSIIAMYPHDIKPLEKHLAELAKSDPTLYYHNIKDKNGKLELDEEKEPFGDSNGESHVKASLTGSYDVVPYKDGKLQLKDGKRIFHIDYDTLEPRKRHVVVTFVNQ